MTTAKVAGTKRVSGVFSAKGKNKSCPKKGVRRKVAGKMMTVKGNHRLKSDATKSAEATRRTGKNARIIKTVTCGYTVFVSGTAKKKSTTKKRTKKTA